MKKRVDKEIIQYYIDGLNMDELVETVKSGFNPKLNDYDLTNPIEVFYKEYNESQPSKPVVKKQDTKLYHKVNYIIHLLCKKSIQNKGKLIPIKASMLQQVIGYDYAQILNKLMLKGVINKITLYEVGEYPMSYNISDKYINRIKTRTSNNRQLIKYETKEQEFTNVPEINTPSDKEVRTDIKGNPLYDNYNKSLALLTLKFKEEAQTYTSKRRYLTNIQELYYHNIINNYRTNNKIQISSIDKNHRIYSLLTSTPKDIRQFLNIKYILDIKNSHPLLFNYYLIKEFDINNNIIDFINDIIKELVDNHNVVSYDNENIRKQLKNSNIIKQQNAKTPIDVLMYMINVSAGRFWDDLLEEEGEHSFLLRSDIKVTLFAQVFYSNTRNTRYKPYAKAFKEKYPNVYKTINKNKPKGYEKALSNDLMSLESEIFQKILSKLYKKRGCNVLSIHDAVVLLDTKGSQKYSPQDIEVVMKKVFQEYNLYPTINVESFVPDQWEKELEVIEKNQPVIQNLLNELKEQASNPEHRAKNTLKWIEKGKVEIIVHRGKPILHPLVPFYELI